MPALASRVGKEAQTLVPDDGGNGNHVPDFLRNDVGSEEINFVEAIIRSGPAALNPVARPFKALGGLDLNAPPESPVIENEVVAFVVSPGRGHAETKTDSLEYENEFRASAFAFFRRAPERGEVG